MPTHLGRLLAQRAALNSHWQALVAAEDHWSFGEMDARCSRLAAHLRAQGVAEGDRIAVLARNSEFLVNAIFAGARLGAIVVVLNWRLQVAELDYILADSEPAALLYEDAFAPVAQALLKTRPLQHVLRSGGAAEDDDYARLMAGPVPAIAAASGPGGQATAVIMYTSGTTGRPKGAMLSHDTLLWTAHGNSSSLVWDHNHRFLLVAPLFHIGGLSPLITNILVGCTTLLLPEFDPVQVWRTIDAEGVTSLMCVPQMLQALLLVKRQMPVDGSSLVTLTCGASPVPRWLIDASLAADVPVQQVYGATEFGGAISFWTRAMGSLQAGTQGRAMMFAELKIVDTATRQELPAGEVGEIWCRGPMCFSGYWRDEAATRAALHEGWYRTGDLGLIDAAGFLNVVDRLKDLIISGGENIYPAELESVIATLPGVAAVAVVGRADPRWGEVPVAFVVCRPGATLDAAEVVQACRERLAGYKCVKAVEFIDALPLNPVGKVLKQQLRARVPAP